MVSDRFTDRCEAGHALAALLADHAGRDIVLALPRGGVPVGYEVARALRAPLDVFVVRKLGMPGQEELAFGAIASGGARVLNEEVVDMTRLPREKIDRITAREMRELERREELYRGDREPHDVRDRTVILVDDGLATGSTMRAAVTALRARGPARIIVAVPLAAPQTRDAFRSIADDIVCVRTPEPFHAVGLWYEDFSQTSDDEVRMLLARAEREHALAAPSDTWKK
jgi:predicted phosphoribosyltransferase